MNAKKAKQLRKMARKLSFESTKYNEKVHPLKRSTNTGQVYSPKTITLHPDCRRGIYQRMKKAA